MSAAFEPSNGPRGTFWTFWFVLFGLEFLGVMIIPEQIPEIGFQDTHWNQRMGLLTLIIIGEGVIAITRIVSMTVRPGGWTKWSFVHILGVTASVVSGPAPSVPFPVLTKRSTCFGRSISISPRDADSTDWRSRSGLCSTFRFMWP